MRSLLVATLLVSPAVAHADTWSPTTCGPEPRPPHEDLTTRGGYNEAVNAARAYQQSARTYSSCVLAQAHTDETAISHAAQNRIADIQAIAVAKQQTIYARLAAQSDRFRAAAAKLSAR